MDSLAVRVAEILFVLIWFGIGVFATQLSWRVDLNALKGKRQTLLVALWYYGVAFQVFIVTLVYLSMLILLALRLN